MWTFHHVVTMLSPCVSMCFSVWLSADVLWLWLPGTEGVCLQGHTLLCRQPDWRWKRSRWVLGRQLLYNTFPVPSSPILLIYLLPSPPHNNQISTLLQIHERSSLHWSYTGELCLECHFVLHNMQIMAFVISPDLAVPLFVSWKRSETIIVTGIIPRGSISLDSRPWKNMPTWRYFWRPLTHPTRTDQPVGTL